MPISHTKNNKSIEVIKDMVQLAFGNDDVEEITELTEGFFNVAYNVLLADGREVILKIAPKPDRMVMTHEKNIMFSEVDCMKVVEERTKVPVPKVLFYDATCTVCDSPYFFMDKLEGKSFSTQMDKLFEEVREDIFKQMGEYTAAINEIHGEKFGYYGQPEKQGTNWYQVFRSMLFDIFEDADRKKVDLKIDKEKLIEQLEENRTVFERVTVPKLVHWDIWAGNVFIHENKISGIIDFERCLWADELMEVGFRTYEDNKSFFEGYGKCELNPEEKTRAKWYDVYLLLIMCLEGAYRKYDTDDIYNWASGMLKDLL